MEKLSRNFSKLQDVLKRGSSFLLVIHPKPDADALGTAFAFKEYLTGQHKKEVEIYCIDKPARELEKLFPIEEVQNKLKLENFDNLVFLDRGDIYYKLKFDQKLKELNTKPRIINIDHHPDTSIENALNVCDAEAAATCEIIYRYFDYINFDIDPKIAQHLLNGIFSDTGGFRHNNTKPESLEIAGNLMRKGASTIKISKILYFNKSLQTLKLWSIALERARLEPRSGMVISFLTKKDLEDCGATSADISGISEILNTIAESKFSLILAEPEKNKIKASLRSDEHKGVDVSQIARQFQGGGHKLASGFEIKGRLKQVGENWVIE
ncbi:MAG: bifunctional oligoribonuclease/PAP phosphatase NrnA [Candidatus Moranbacteria bacterium]|nr:bifunctional oligoribonuclease/PAP phosphatase NrnA [Candidatus Moranbacteria bacterium]